MKNNKDQIKQLKEMIKIRENEIVIINRKLKEPHGYEAEERLQTDLKKNKEAIARYEAEINRLETK